MNIRLQWLIVFCLFWAGLVSAQTVEIPDPNLEQVIRAELQLPPDAPITKQEMLRLTRLIAPRSEIADLTGLEYAVNIKQLGLHRNQIVDISPLAGLTNLIGFNLWNNQIVDISPLRNLTKLSNIILTRNQIVDISPLAGLTNLVSLGISDNRIVDFSPLANLVNLEILRIDGNESTDVSALQGLNLTEFVYDSICNISPPDLTVKERMANRNFPSVGSAWAGIGWSSVLNLPQLSDLEQLSLHDLFFSSPFGLGFVKHAETWQVIGSLEEAQAQREAYVALNPNMIFLVSIHMRGASNHHYPEDWPYWVRDADGNRVVAPQGRIDPNVFLVDFTHPDMQDQIVSRRSLWQIVVYTMESFLIGGMNTGLYSETLRSVGGRDTEAMKQNNVPEITLYVVSVLR